MLEICTLSLASLTKMKIDEPSIYFVFNQNPSKDKKGPFMEQIQNMMKEISDANKDASKVA